MPDDLRTFFRTRDLIDRGELATLSVSAIDRFRVLREQFNTASFEALYAEWRHRGEAALASFRGPSVCSVGQLVTDLLPFDYSQFGSLPGVA